MLIPPRPFYFVLTRAQQHDLDRINQALLDCARELYKHPEHAPEIGLRCYNELGIPGQFNLSGIDEAWFPGGLTAFSYEQVKTGQDLVVLNPNTLQGYEWFCPYVLTAVVRPRVDQCVVVKRVKNTNYIRYEPLQNTQVIILPDPFEQVMPGIKDIIFDEDYQYQMIDPDLLDHLLHQT